MGEVFTLATAFPALHRHIIWHIVRTVEFYQSNLHCFHVLLVFLWLLGKY